MGYVHLCVVCCMSVRVLCTYLCISLTHSLTRCAGYLGTDGNVGTQQFDFATVFLHEMMHGLGIYSLYALPNPSPTPPTGVYNYNLPQAQSSVFDVRMADGIHTRARAHLRRHTQTRHAQTQTYRYKLSLPLSLRSLCHTLLHRHADTHTHYGCAHYGQQVRLWYTAPTPDVQCSTLASRNNNQGGLLAAVTSNALVFRTTNGGDVSLYVLPFHCVDLCCVLCV